MLKVLVVDDDEMMLQATCDALESANTRIYAFNDPIAAAASAGEHDYDVVITDQRMPEMNGLTLLEHIRDLSPSTKRVLVSAYREFDDVTKAFNTGVLHRFLIKPWNITTLRQVFLSCLDDNPVLPPANEEERTFPAPASVTGSKVRSFHGMLSSHESMLRLFDFVERTGHTGGPFHVCGETGTGKELVAKAIHTAHRGNHRPFVAVNCANLPELMLESLFFGHRKGSFTGAIADQVGYLEAANGGTLFLDEITELPLGLQAKLLRVLQEREYVRLGDTVPRSIDISVVSASQVTLDDAVRSGRFRADLKYRLDVLPVRLPPLRERGVDTLMLFDHFLDETWQRVHGRGEIWCSQETRKILQKYQWPGNVRELINIATYVCAMLSNSGGEITPGHLPDALTAAMPRQAAPSLTISIPPAIDKRAVLDALSVYRNNKSAAARALGISRMTLWRYMQAV